MTSNYSWVQVIENRIVDQNKAEKTPQDPFSVQKRRAGLKVDLHKMFIGAAQTFSKYTQAMRQVGSLHWRTSHLVFIYHIDIDALFIADCSQN